MLYFRPEREVKFYLGAGPYVGYDLGRRERNEATLERSQRFTVGIGGRLGTEWFATKSISLLAEYGNLLSTSHWELEGVSGADLGAREYAYSNSVRVGLSLYL